MSVPPYDIGLSILACHTVFPLINVQMSHSLSIVISIVPFFVFSFLFANEMAKDNCKEVEEDDNVPSEVINKVSKTCTVANEKESKRCETKFFLLGVSYTVHER